MYGHQVNGCLSYSEKVPDGFYIIDHMHPYMWTMCTDLQESGRIPSIESLKSIAPTFDSSISVVWVDIRNDPSLKELQNMAHRISTSCITVEEVVGQLAELVCGHMGYDNLKNTFLNVVPTL